MRFVYDDFFRSFSSVTGRPCFFLCPSKFSDKRRKINWQISLKFLTSSFVHMFFFSPISFRMSSSHLMKNICWFIAQFFLFFFFSSLSTNLMILGQFVVTTISYVYSRGSPVHVAATTERGEMTERDASSTQLWRIKKKNQLDGIFFRLFVYEFRYYLWRTPPTEFLIAVVNFMFDSLNILIVNCNSCGVW